MELIDIYNNVQNPIQSDEIISKLLTAYSNTGGSFYIQVTNISGRDAGGYINADDKTEFFVNNFNIWRENILKLSKSQLANLQQKGYKDYDKLQTILRTTKPVTSLDDIAKLKENELVFDSCWDAVSQFNAWEHVRSRDIGVKQEERIDVQHRLYVDCDNLDLYKMANLLMEKCKGQGIPFYFKFDETARYREDQLILYSSTERLADYVQILQEIGKEHPEILARCGEPPALTGRIDNWIGIGDEPKKVNGQSRSFNQVRSTIIEKAISDVTLKSILGHKEYNVQLNGKEQNLNDVFINANAECLIDKLKSYAEFSEFFERRGLTEKDLDSDKFKAHLDKHIRSNISKVINGMQSNNKLINFSIPTRDGKSITFGFEDLENSIKKMIPILQKIDPNINNSTRDEILTNASREGIDIDKFCFDVGTKERFENTRTATPIQNNRTKPTSDTILKNTIPDIIAEDGEILSIRITEKLNPTLMKQRVKLPNGVEISAKQYVEEFVAQHIPQSGMFILKNGTEISAKQYIEEFVMFQGQQEFNGDIKSLLEETTRANNGNINITGKRSIDIGNRNNTKENDSTLSQKTEKLEQTISQANRLRQEIYSAQQQIEQEQQKQTHLNIDNKQGKSKE